MCKTQCQFNVAKHCYVDHENKIKGYDETQCRLDAGQHCEVDDAKNMERVRCRRDVARCWPNLRCKQEDKNTTQHQFDFDQLHCYVIVVDDVNKVEGARCGLNVIQCVKTLRCLLCRCIQDVWCKQDIKKRCKIDVKSVLQCSWCRWTWYMMYRAKASTTEIQRQYW